MNILVSHCFLGEPCRYDGQSRLDRQVIELHRAGHNLIPVCPELLGGLDVPRSPAEIQPDGRVVTQDGQDVTAAYRVHRGRAEGPVPLLRLRGGVRRHLYPHGGPRLGVDRPPAGRRRHRGDGRGAPASPAVPVIPVRRPCT